MKTTISIPDELFQKLDALAKRTNKPRSQICRRALTEYLARHDIDAITQRWNAVLKKTGADTDECVTVAAQETLLRRD